MGRPRVKPEDRVITPPRQIGRVKDADWDLLLEAVEVSGETKTAWMTSVLMREARKVLRKKEHADRN